MKKRIVSLCMAIALLLTLLPQFALTVNAEDLSQSENKSTDNSSNWAEAYIPAVEEAIALTTDIIDDESFLNSFAHGILYDIDDDGVYEMVLSYLTNLPETWWTLTYSVYDFENGELLAIAKNATFGASVGIADSSGYTGLAFHNGEPVLITYSRDGGPDSVPGEGAKYAEQQKLVLNIIDYPTLSPQKTIGVQTTAQEITYSVDGNIISETAFSDEMEAFTYLEFHVDSGRIAFKNTVEKMTLNELLQVLNTNATADNTDLSENASDGITDESGQPDNDEDDNEFNGNETSQESANTITFSDIPAEYTLTSGAGAWTTGLTLSADGSFEGSYHDSNMGETGAGYSRGTVYYCNFSGIFSNPEPVNEYTYKVILESFSVADQTGYEYIDNEIKYIASDPYGFDDTNEYYIYLPGIPNSMLPQNVFDWVSRLYGSNFGSYEVYVICSANGELPFVGEFKDAPAVDVEENDNEPKEKATNDLVVYSDYINQSIRKGSTITLSAGILSDGALTEDISGITFQVEDTSILSLSTTGIENNCRYVELIGLAKGTTVVVFNDSITGYTVRIPVTVYDNNYLSYTLNSVPTQNIGKYPTNVYNVNGLYIDSYKYTVNDDQSATVSFDVYNTNYTYGAVEVFDVYGNMKDAVLIEKRTSSNTSIKEAVWDNIGYLVRDFIDGDFLTYRQESGYAKKTSISVNIPQNGYIKICTDPENSLIVAFVNTVDGLMSMASLAGDIKDYDVNSKELSEKMTTKLLTDQIYIELIKDGSDAPKELWKNIGKETFITSESLGSYTDTIAKNIDELKLGSVIADTAEDFGWDVGENVFTDLTGAAGTGLNVVFTIGKVENFIIQQNDLIQSAGVGSIYIQNQGGGLRSCQQIKVESENEFASDTALNVYTVSLDSTHLDVIKELNPDVYEAITNGTTYTYNISLLKNGDETQPNGKVTVYIPIPEDLKALTYAGELTGGLSGKVKIYRVEEDGSLTEMDVEIEDGCFVFTTDHFSLYTIVGYDSGDYSNIEKEENTPSDSKKNHFLIVGCVILCGIVLFFLMAKNLPTTKASYNGLKYVIGSAIVIVAIIVLVQIGDYLKPEDGNEYQSSTDMPSTSTPSTQVDTIPPETTTPATEMQSPQNETKTMIELGAFHSVYLREDGTVAATGANDKSKYKNHGLRCDVSGWTDVVAISASTHTLGLTKDGMVKATGVDRYGQCSVEDWSNIVSISAGDNHSLGVRSDGTVVAAGYNEYGQCDVHQWQDVIQVAAGTETSYGLRSNGTVLSAGSSRGRQTNTNAWSDIISISTGSYFVVGLISDGTIITAGASEAWADEYSTWTDIVAVCAGSAHIVAVRSDGTVVACGDGSYGQCDVSSWTDIVSIGAGMYHTIGMKRDGTLVGAGHNAYGQLDLINYV